MNASSLSSNAFCNHLCDGRIFDLVDADKCLVHKGKNSAPALPEHQMLLVAVIIA